MADHDFDKLVADAKAKFDALPPEEQAAHREAQRQSWVRGEMGMGETAVMVKPMTADRTQRVTDERLMELRISAVGGTYIDPDVACDAFDDLRDSRALTQAQAATIAELRAEVERLKAEWEVERDAGTQAQMELAHQRNEAQSALATATAQIEKLKAALKPFADRVIDYISVGVRYDDTFELWQNGWRTPLNVGHIRAAAAALSEDKPHG